MCKGNLCWNVFTNLRNEETSSINTHTYVLSVLCSVLQHALRKLFHTQSCICTTNTPLPPGNTHLAATTRTVGNHKRVSIWLTESCVINTISAQCVWTVAMTGGACLIYFLCSKINRPTFSLNTHFWSICTKNSMLSRPFFFFNCTSNCTEWRAEDKAETINLYNFKPREQTF